jgi:hypothetical protein
MDLFEAARFISRVQVDQNYLEVLADPPALQ